jgi:peptidyl-prolyl cis-trans isomerase C
MARKLSFVFFFFVASLGMAQAPAVKAPPGTAALVNGQAVTESAVQRSLERIPPERRAAARPELINHLIDNMLVDQYLMQQKIVADVAEIDKRHGLMKAEIVKQGKDYAKMLEELKLTDAELKEHISAEIRWEKYVDTQATDKALQEIFEQNKEVFNGASVRARHILLTVSPTDEAEMEKARVQLLSYKKQVEDTVKTEMAKLPPTTDNLAKEKARIAILDESFAIIAKDKSTCPSKDQGGDVGWFTRDGVMVENFSRTAFGLPPYMLSDPVKTQFGYHLILTTEKKAGKEVKFDDLKGEAKEYFAEKLRERMAEHVRKFSKITIFPAPAGI